MFLKDLLLKIHVIVKLFIFLFKFYVSKCLLYLKVFYNVESVETGLT